MDMLDTLLELLATASDSQIDETITKRLLELVGKKPEVVVEELKTILDNCVHASLASGFAIVAIENILAVAQEKCEDSGPQNDDEE